MKAQNEKQSLLNFIDSLKRIGLTEFQNATIVLADKRLGRRYAVAMTVNKGTSQEYDTPITDFLLYGELTQFMRGYMFKAENTFDIYK